MREVRVLEEAAQDIEQARDFYEQLESGIGDYFSDSLVSDLNRLSLFHGIHPKLFGFYRMLSGRFPFGIYYRELETRTEVLAVLDLRRNPIWVRAELSNRKS